MVRAVRRSLPWSFRNLPPLRPSRRVLVCVDTRFAVNAAAICPGSYHLTWLDAAVVTVMSLLKCPKREEGDEEDDEGDLEEDDHDEGGGGGGGGDEVVTVVSMARMRDDVSTWKRLNLSPTDGEDRQ